ncbi:[Fe-Fe] hydrogenase large subunit C-terminal domain-containing protein [Desulfotomaculum copahuensis]|uniref:Ferredoxin n=1 Tax=Desulfotomaculum copahuensis TaxID=1838280 RepID=A0A1B7LHG9_9FIRM|nr:[Fe-Fe] hydrogenase large subunit C-terminal domain-containing protein [Desulfotomaculum copahuensis]OAT85725.1 ferredoxin [Desulfotomaculum copahuensis]
MQKYFHSVKLDEQKCKGCTNCIKHCPTEAIRVREGKARIIEERCIDCGECIRVCPNQAKLALTDGLEKLQGYDYKIALPAPSFYGQFKPEVSPSSVLGALLEIGFDDIFEVPVAAEAVSRAISAHLQQEHPRPSISSACPAVVRLMQVRFPALLEHLVPMESPMEIAGRLARERAVREKGLPPEKIGVFFITPCPAKVTAVKQPFGGSSSVDGAISMTEIYGRVLRRLEGRPVRTIDPQSSGLGIGWGSAGGENEAVKTGSLLAVDGIHSVIGVLEEIERGGLDDIDYLEAQACTGGCIGGPLVPQNPFVVRVRMRNLVKKHGSRSKAEFPGNLDFYRLQAPIRPRPVLKLADDVELALTRLEEAEKIAAELPGLDCGSCGSPSCRALAEDIVQGYAQRSYCIFELRQRLQILAAEMVELSHKPPPAMGREWKQSREGGGHNG